MLIQFVISCWSGILVVDKMNTKAVALKLELTSDQQEGLLKCRLLSLTPEFVIHSFWSGALEFSFLTSSLRWRFQRLHFENHGSQACAVHGDYMRNIPPSSSLSLWGTQPSCGFLGTTVLLANNLIPLIELKSPFMTWLHLCKYFSDSSSLV